MGRNGSNTPWKQSYICKRTSVDELKDRNGLNLTAPKIKPSTSGEGIIELYRVKAPDEAPDAEETIAKNPDEVGQWIDRYHLNDTGFIHVLRDDRNDRIISIHTGYPYFLGLRQYGL